MRRWQSVSWPFASRERTQGPDQIRNRPHGDIAECPGGGFCAIASADVAPIVFMGACGAGAPAACHAKAWGIVVDNARCLGCLSLQDSDCTTASHSRIQFVPSPDEIAEANAAIAAAYEKGE